MKQVHLKHARPYAQPAVGHLERKDNAADTDTVETKKLVGDFMKTFKEFSEKTDARFLKLEKEGNADPITTEEVQKMNTSMDTLTKQVEALRLAEKRPQIETVTGQKRELSEIEVKHAQAVGRFMRTGDDSGLQTDEIKSLSVGSNPDGGYTVHAAMETAIDRVLSDVSVMRNIAMVTQISTSSIKRLVNVGGTGSGWVGESSSRPQTDGSNLRQREFPVMELYAMPAATQSLLDDSVVNIEQWIADEVQLEFAEQEGAAFINGNGVDKPRGLIGGYTPIADANFTEAGGRPGYVATGAAGAFKTTADGDDSDNLIDLVYALKTGYRGNAGFIMNRKTQGSVRKIQDANGNKVWQPGLQSGQPATLLGYGISEDDNMPDIAANAYAIAFGDFRRTYLIVDRVGIRVLRDPFTSKPHILFYMTKRVGGGVKLFEGYKLLKFAAS